MASAAEIWKHFRRNEDLSRVNGEEFLQTKYTECNTARMQHCNISRIRREAIQFLDKNNIPELTLRSDLPTIRAMTYMMGNRWGASQLKAISRFKSSKASTSKFKEISDYFR